MDHSNTPGILDAPLFGDELLIPAGSGAPHRATWYRQPSKDAPLVLHLHAGAFVCAPAAGRVTVTEQLLMQAGASVLSLHYPLAPAHPFPDAICAAYATLQYLSRERRRLLRSNGKIIVAGVEAGGNIAAGVALMARDRGELNLSGQILFSPMLDPLLATHSVRGARVGSPGCPYAEGWRQYTPDPTHACHPYAYPARAVRLHGLPPALLFTAADDPFRDETRAYAQRLAHQGIDARLTSLPTPPQLPAAYMREAQTAPTTPMESLWMALVRNALRSFLTGTAYTSNPQKIST